MNNLSYPYKDIKVYGSTPIAVEMWDDQVSVEMHCHSFYEFALITKGSCIHNYRGVQVPLIPGDVFIIEPHQPHGYEIQSHVSIINCMFFPEQIKLYLTPENMEKAYGKFREGCKNKDYVVRLRLSGFFWTPRFLMGNEEQLYAYYDEPDVLKDICRFVTDVYKEQLDGILKIVTPSLVFFEEDLSGKTGPMISPTIFEEFITPYYKEMIPFLKERGVQNVIMDTDGDFTIMIPKILECGLDGVLPVDVNAGVDIVKVREKFPTLKFIGGFNKLCIIKGEEAIETELERLKPVIRQGGCIICTDHQAAPHTPLKYYQYYTRRLKEVMAELRNENVPIG